MKRIFAFILMMAALQLSAQQFVSTVPQNKNVIIEEFTGRSCPNCPDGHRIANAIMEAYPGRVWAINLHSGGNSPYSYPNLNTSYGDAISYGFGIDSWPQAVVNRSTEEGLSRTEWATYTNSQLALSADCNIGGQVVIDEASRTATINIEVYYTANSAENTNYLTVIMLQDDIVGSQQGGNTNPDQYINGQYHHYDVFRDVITPTWGDPISPTTSGSLITKSYTYNIPQSIGNPNPVTVDIDNIWFLAFVTEKYQGTPTRPVLNANKLNAFMGTSENIYPYITSIIPNAVSCSNEKKLNVTIANGGLQALTSLDFEVTIDGGSAQDYSWQGNIPSYNVSTVEIPISMSGGDHNVTVKIVKANGTNFNTSETVSVSSEDMSIATIVDDEEELTIEIMQDKYGMQTTWEVLDTDYNVIASGGPYQYLSGSTATELHTEKVMVSDGDCVMLVIKDDGGNGICCQFGDGYYKVKNAQGNVIVDGDGAFGSEARHLLSVIKSEDGTQNISAQICEGENYTEYGFNIEAPEVGVYQYENEYNGVTFLLTLTVVERPEVTIVGNTEISQGETTVLIASGADSYVWSSGETSAMITISPDETTTYSVIGTKNGCEDTAEVTVNVTVGVEENLMKNVEIYPNPTNGELNIECKGMHEITVFLPNGQTIENIKVNTDSYILDMNDYDSGVYYLRIIGEGTIVKKVVKQ